MSGNRLDDAIQLFRLNVQRFPASPNGYDSLGEALMTKGDLVAAETCYQRLLALDPRNANARAMLVRIRGARPNQRSVAEVLWQSVVSFGPSRRCNSAQEAERPQPRRRYPGRSDHRKDVHAGSGVRKKSRPLPDQLLPKLPVCPTDVRAAGTYISRIPGREPCYSVIMRAHRRFVIASRHTPFTTARAPRYAR